MKMEVYFDNSATTRPFDEICKEISEFLNKCYGNPSSIHQIGVEAEKTLKNARNVIAKSLGITSEEVFFTSGGTESNNIGVLGIVNANKKRISQLITTSIEHPSVLNLYKFLENQGYKVSFLPIDKEGIINIEVLESLLKKEPTTLVSIMHVNNEVGSIQPIEEVIKLKKQFGFTLHVDAVQSYCKLDLKKICKEVDLISFSGHKIHALKGIGGLVIKKGTKLEPIYYGGGQEKNVKPGTENMPGIWSLGRAVEINMSNKYGNFEKVRELKNLLVNRILEEIPGTVFNGSLDTLKSAPHIANISFKGIPGEVLLHALEAYGIYVSTTSACSVRKREPSHVLMSMGIDRNLIKSSIRFSLSLTNTKDEIEYCIDSIKNIVKTLRR